MKEFSDIDSKFRYIIVASKRAKQLLKGAKPKIKSKSRNLIRVAQQEVQQGLIEFEIIENPVEEFVDTGDDMFIGEEIPAVVPVIEEVPEAVAEVAKEPLLELKIPKKAKAPKKATKKVEEDSAKEEKAEPEPAPAKKAKKKK